MCALRARNAHGSVAGRGDLLMDARTVLRRSGQSFASVRQRNGHVVCGGPVQLFQLGVARRTYPHRVVELFGR